VPDSLDALSRPLRASSAEPDRYGATRHESGTVTMAAADYQRLVADARAAPDWLVRRKLENGHRQSEPPDVHRLLFGRP
jgi:hypothetical protein